MLLKTKRAAGTARVENDTQSLETPSRFFASCKELVKASPALQEPPFCTKMRFPRQFQAALSVQSRVGDIGTSTMGEATHPAVLPLCKGHLTGEETEAQHPQESPGTPNPARAVLPAAPHSRDSDAVPEQGNPGWGNPNSLTPKHWREVSCAGPVQDKPCSLGTAPPLLDFNTAGRGRALLSPLLRDVHELCVSYLCFQIRA